MTLLHKLPSARRAAPVCDEANLRRGSVKAVARSAGQHGLGVDVYSPDDLAVALAGGIDPARVIMHVNALSRDELRGAVAAGVGRVVIDNPMQIGYLADLVRRQRVLIQVIPDIDVHGHRCAGVSEEQLGFTVAGDHAADAVRWVLAHRSLDLVGLHCRIADPALSYEVIHRMIASMADIRAHHGLILTELCISPPSCGDPRELAAVIEDALDEGCAGEHFPRPTVVVEVPAGDYEGILART